MKILTVLILASTSLAGNPSERLKLDCEIAQSSEAPQMAETESERTERLFNDFENALLMFDRCLEVATDNAQSASSAAANGGGASGESAEDDSAQTETDSQNAPSEQNENNAETQNSNAGDQEPENNTPPSTTPAPDDVSNGNDDDVVAKQLREAAMAEKDPIVREKLWDEYRKYKGIKK